MFHLYHSNDLDVLRGILVRLMSDNPPTPFEQEAILVQSQGMAHWLKLQLADGLGIAAQIDFPLPSSFVWKIFNRLKPELPERSHFEKQSMAWKLMRLLPQLIHQPQYQAIAHYLEDDEHGLRCYQLAHKIADVFDQYLVYRPDWLLSWEAGGDQVEGTDVSRQPWQPGLWRALVADSEALGHSLDHRARLAQQLESLVADHPERLQDLPQRLFVFGIAALPGSYWQVLQAISPVIDVHFFLLNPCRNFWGDIIDDRRRLQILKKQPAAEHYFERGNPLLASWGKLGREFLTLVHDSDMADIEAWVEHDGSNLNLLAHLQQDILNLEDAQQGAFSSDALTHSQFKKVVADNDTSIRFVSAHNPLREVQQLHDQLLSWFAADPQLKPRDVVVMVPDIDQYAPYIDAVFSSVADHTRIPWAIADQSMVQENPIIDGWLRLLALPDSRLLITEVQDWLDIAAVRRRFDIADEELDSLKDWLQRAEIRWGLNAGHRQQLGLPGFEQNSWRKGLRQLLLGLMLPDNAGQFHGDYPVAAVEGNAGESLGKLMHFIDQLEYWQQQLSVACNSQEWQQRLQQMIGDFFAADLQENASLQKVRDTIARWCEGLDDAAFDQTLTPQVVRSWFVEQLAQQGGWQRFLAGPVNFCTLMPMRSIPFKAVCMLGMNDEDYPRRVTPIGFDLMVSGSSRRGDRSRRDDDRYLFLEAVCSAQQFLYISYRGRDARENNELQPSVLVSELQDYLCDGYCLEALLDLPHQQSREAMLKHLRLELPLQPFNAQHFYSYQPVWADVANSGGNHGKSAAGNISVNNSANNSSTADNTAFLQHPLPIPEDIQTSDIHWQDVKQALLQPTRFFVQRRLRSNLDIYWQHHLTEEPFVPDNLELFQLRESWLAAYRQQQQSDYTERQQASGKLPVNQLGRVWSEDIGAQLSPMAEQLDQLCAQPLPAVTLQWQLHNNSRVIAEVQDAFAFSTDNQVGDTQAGDDTVTDNYGHQYVYHRVGSIRGQHVWRVWLELVIAAAARPGLIAQATLLGLDKKRGLSVTVLRAPSQALAAEHVKQMVSWYWQCWQQPQPLIADLLWHDVGLQQTTNNDADGEALWQARQKHLHSQLNNEFSPLQDQYLRRCLPQLSEQLQQPEGYQQWLEPYQALFMDIANHLIGEVE